MKKWIALLFMVVLAGTLLPAVLPLDGKKIVLFATPEEEQSEIKKDIKAKDLVLAGWENPFQLFTHMYSRSGYPNIFVLLSDDPYLDHHTPPPDTFC